MDVCASPATGQQFLGQTLSFIDCQSRAIGEAGYLIFSAPDSSAMALVTIGLTVFVALFGIRLLLGHPLLLSDTVLAVLKIGIVLTLAASWPTVRILVYDTALSGPAEIASSLGARADGDAMQRIDNGLVELTRVGTGRSDLSIGATGDGRDASEAFRGEAFSDDIGFAIGRFAFLASAIGAFGFVRFGAGLLIGLTPFFAGLLLFGVSRSFFFGWARSIFAAAFGSLIIAIMWQLQVLVLDPWINSAIALRSANYAISSAPIELAVIATGFALATFALLGLAMRICFTADFALSVRHVLGHGQDRLNRQQVPAIAGARGAVDDGTVAPARAFGVAQAVTTAKRREQEAVGNRASRDASSPPGQPASASGVYMPQVAARRSRRQSRVSGLGLKRDLGQ